MKVLIDRAIVEQALEALIKGCNINATEWHQAIYALRAALAQQDEPAQEPITRLFGTLPVHDAQQEPVAWSGYDLDGMVEAFSRVIEAHYQRANPFQNPIDMDAQMALRILREFIPAMKAYAVPPQRKN